MSQLKNIIGSGASIIAVPTSFQSKEGSKIYHVIMDGEINGIKVARGSLVLEDGTFFRMGMPEVRHGNEINFFSRDESPESS